MFNIWKLYVRTYKCFFRTLILFYFGKCFLLTTRRPLSASLLNRTRASSCILFQNRCSGVSMSSSSPPPPFEEVVGSAGCLPPGYKPFDPVEHGLERGFRLTAFSDLKGWGCKVPQEALLKLLSGLEPDRAADESGKAEDQASEFVEQLSGPRLGEEQSYWLFLSSSNLCSPS